MLRNDLIDLVIKDILITKSLLKYQTGKQFIFFLRGISSEVDIHDYNVLDNIAFDNIRNYLIDNKNKAIEIFETYNISNDENNKFEDLEKFLKSNIISNAKQDLEEKVIV
jgi:hypothetical protein